MTINSVVERVATSGDWAVMILGTGRRLFVPNAPKNLDAIVGVKVTGDGRVLRVLGKVVATHINHTTVRFTKGVKRDSTLTDRRPAAGRVRRHGG